MATMAESAPTNSPEIALRTFSTDDGDTRATVDSADTAHGDQMSGDSSHKHDSHSNQCRISSGMQEEFGEFRNHTVCRSTTSNGVAPLVTVANGRGESSQDSGSDCGLVDGGKLRENGEQFHTCSSTSGEGSSVWSEEGSNEQEAPHYALLDSEPESELSSPVSLTQSPIAEEPLSLTGNLNHTSTTTGKTQVPIAGPSTTKVEEVLSVTDTGTMADIPLPLSPSRAPPDSSPVASDQSPSPTQDLCCRERSVSPTQDTVPSTSTTVTECVSPSHTQSSGVVAELETNETSPCLQDSANVDEVSVPLTPDIKNTVGPTTERDHTASLSEHSISTTEEEDHTLSLIQDTSHAANEALSFIDSLVSDVAQPLTPGSMPTTFNADIFQSPILSTDFVTNENGVDLPLSLGEVGSHVSESVCGEPSDECGVSGASGEIGESVEAGRQASTSVEEEGAVGGGEEREGDSGDVCDDAEGDTNATLTTGDQLIPSVGSEEVINEAEVTAQLSMSPPQTFAPLVINTSSFSHALDDTLRQRSASNLDSTDFDEESNLDSSNLDSGVRPPHHPSTNLPILPPLSPDPGLNEQYEHLRRTLSHSRRRYSTRRKRPQRRENGERVQRSESSVGVRRDLRAVRDRLQNEDHRRVETHVDVHGRTYFMDHDTHTVVFEPDHSQVTDISRGMEMLERRYLSLQRSFRGGQRPSRFAQPVLSPIASSPSTPLDLSLSLTRAEAESLSQATSGTSRSQSRTSNSKRRSSRWKFWQRSYRSVHQSHSTSSAEDDVLPVSPGWEGSPPPAVTASGEVVEGVRRVRSESREGSVARSSQSSETTLSGSVAGTSEEGEGERERTPQEQAAQLTTSAESEEVVTAVTVTANGEVPAAVAIAGQTERTGEQGEGERQTGGDEVFRETGSAPTRQLSILRASEMSTTDRTAAHKARHRVRATTVRARHRRRPTDRDTDDETNAEPAQQRVATSSPTPEEREGQEEEVAKEPLATPTSVTPLPEGLLVSPALRFITRRDLYTFLSSAGDAGEMFLANRGLMELVQRIRTNNNLFAKYQHSRQLVTALNRFADTKADLPEKWERKLNREGKVFYIDHTHCVTSFIDPRLPGPDHEFSYTAPASLHPSQQPQQLQFGDEAPIRAHHTTVMPSSGGGATSSAASPPTPSVSVTSPQPPDQEMTYERQVVSFFRHPDIYQRIAQRYQRGVRPQLREIIEDVRANGTSALERIQTSGSVAAYELALVLSLFEDDISAINTMIEVLPPQPVREDRPTGGPQSVSTLQRKKEAFSTKLQTFKVMMARLGFAQSSRLKFNLRRDHLLEDSYEHVMKSDVRHLQRKRLNICFKGEDGLDYGGPSREFFFLLSREVFNPYYGLFEYSANDTYTVQISPTSMFIQNHLDWFRFAGRVIGLAIVQGFLLDVFFTRTIYKALANRAPSLKDLESLEPAFYSSLVWIRENDPEPLDLTFTVEEEAFGELSTHELKEGGMDIPVTDDNKEEYIHLMLRWRLDRGINSQMSMLRKGFSEVMPVSLLQAFDASEVEFLTAGTLEIDVDDWKKHTEYRNGYHPTHPVILHFWQAVEMFDNEQRLRLLQFVTGTSSVPFEGFKALRGSNGPKRFTIDFFSDIQSLPRTHTCFNRIDLPPYPSYDILYHKLLIAIEEGNTFGIE